MSEYAALGGREREVREKITAEAWNLILSNTDGGTIQEQGMKDFAYSLGDAVGGEAPDGVLHDVLQDGAHGENIQNAFNTCQAARGR